MDGHVAAGRAHGDGNVSGRQRWRVVHAVPHHRDPMPRRLQVVHYFQFLVGQYFRLNVRAVHLGRDALGHAPAVAGHHHQLLQADVPQRVQGVGRVGADFVFQADPAQQAAGPRDNQQAQALSVGHVQGADVHAAFSQPVLASDQDLIAIDHGAHPVPGKFLKLRGIRQCQARAPRDLDHRARHRMP